MPPIRPAREFIRRFPENGLKLLLEHPGNVDELLAVGEAPERAWINFRRMRRERTTYVGRDYRSVEADVVLRAPLLRRFLTGARREVWIYLLIEHQSEPDEVMPLRLLDYQLHIYKAQLRDWMSRHPSAAGFRLQPVIPLVLYTGTRRWERLGQLAGLMEMGEHFGKWTPTWEPLFLNVGALSPRFIEAEGGAFGWILRALQQRHTNRQEFAALLRQAVDGLEGKITAAERERILELFSYLVALVYNERDPAEHRGLQEQIEDAVDADWLRQEIRTMGETMADVLRAEGRKEGERKGRKKEAVRARRQTLLLLLREQFGDVPAGIVASVQACKNTEQLDTWVLRVVRAQTLQDVGIIPQT
jgi:hypothetical protein